MPTTSRKSTSDSGGEILLKVRDLSVHFPVRRNLLGRVTASLRAVDGVSFDIKSGATLGLVGESGCGKTTLGRAILRLVTPIEGQVQFAGVNVLSASPGRLRALRRDMQIIFQDPVGSLDPLMTVGGIIAEPMAIHRAAAPRRRRTLVHGLLERVGLQPAHADRYPHEFSGGQRQRIGIARAIALNPRFVVCDEPVSALDVSIQAQILNLLKELQGELGLTYLFIAHNLAVVRHFCDEVAVMYLGRIVEFARADDLYSQPRHPYTLALLDAVPAPDPKLRRRRATPSGDRPSPIDQPAGCAYHSRCPLATDICRQTTPALRAEPGLPPGHLVACHRYDSVPKYVSIDSASAH